MQVKRIQKKVRLDSIEDIVRLQLALYCSVHSILLNKTDFHCLFYIALNGYNGSATVKAIKEQGIGLGTLQSVRNSRNLLVKLGLLQKVGKHHFPIHPDIRLENEGIIALDIKAINVPK